MDENKLEKVGRIIAADIMEDISIHRLGFVLLVYDPGGHASFITHNSKDSRTIGACLVEVGRKMQEAPQDFPNVDG